MKVKKKLLINCKIGKVFTSIANGLLFEATGLLKGSLQIDFQEGGEYSLKWPEAGNCKGQFIKIEPDKQIHFSWIKSEAKYTTTQLTTEVKVTLSEIDNDTNLELIHSGFTEKMAYDSHNQGWNEVLEIFKNSCSKRTIT